MEDRTKVAAAAASVIPFSCIICFDEFDSQERPPMILPCGHTYVCLPCTKRLKRCMECRQSLFLPSAAAAAAAAPHFPSHGTTAHYYHHHPANSQYNQYNLQHRALAQRYGTLPDVGPPPLTPPHSTLHGSSSHNQPIPLPIPKNLVLLSMMEAAERQARIKHQQHQQQQQQQLAAAFEDGNDDDDDDDSDNDDNEDDDDDENEAFDLDKIITGMATLSGPCGTYAVREKGGLVVVRADPRRRRNDTTNDFSTDEDDDDDDDEDDTPLYGHPSQEINLQEEKKDEKKENIEFSQQDASTSVEEGERDEKKEEEVADEAVAAAAYDEQEEPQSPIPLEYGQTVQVVSFEDGVAKLARSQGYVLGNASQLVKVGGALDESCRLEGLLHTVLSRGEDLQKTLDDNRQIERGLQRQLEMAMSTEPSHPIISPLPRRHDEDDDQHDDPHPNNNNNNNNYDTDDCKLPASSSHDPDDTHNPAAIQLLQTPQLAATALLNTPERSVTEVYHTPQQRSVMDDDGNANGEHTPATPRSPNSIDNSDIGIGPYMPHYRECDSQDDNNSATGGRMVDFGCASVLLEEGAELFGENVVGSGIISGDRSVRSTGARDRRRRTTYSPTIDEQGGGASSNRIRSSSIEVLGQRSHMAASAASASGSSHHHNHPAPTLTASFDNIDFRTGLSGHRALTTAHLHSSPKPNKRHIRMSEHRGLGR